MKTNWDQLPVEMLQVIVDELDAMTRVKLSMCSKFENQLIRGRKRGKVEIMCLGRYGFQIIFHHNDDKNEFYGVTIKPQADGGGKVYVNERRPEDDAIETYSTTDWKETIMNIMRLLGTTIKVDALVLHPLKPFQEFFNWLRRNIHIETQRVEFYLDHFSYDHFDESIFDWSSNASFTLRIYSFDLPNFERFNTYEKIVAFQFDNMEENGGAVTDEDLKKMINVKRVDLINTDVTLDGVHWWLKKWINEKDDIYIHRFSIYFKKDYECSDEQFYRKMSDVIENADPSKPWRSESWKIKKKNENNVGTLRFQDECLSFLSDTNWEVEKDDSDSDSDETSDEDVETDRDVEMGNVSNGKKSSETLILLIVYGSVSVPFIFIALFCFVYLRV